MEFLFIKLNPYISICGFYLGFLFFYKQNENILKIIMIFWTEISNIPHFIPKNIFFLVFFFCFNTSLLISYYKRFLQKIKIDVKENQLNFKPHFHKIKESTLYQKLDNSEYNFYLIFYLESTIILGHFFLNYFNLWQQTKTLLIFFYYVNYNRNKTYILSLMFKEKKSLILFFLIIELSLKLENCFLSLMRTGIFLFETGTYQKIRIHLFFVVFYGVGRFYFIIKNLENFELTIFLVFLILLFELLNYKCKYHLELLRQRFEEIKRKLNLIFKLDSYYKSLNKRIEEYEIETNERIFKVMNEYDKIINSKKKTLKIDEKEFNEIKKELNFEVYPDGVKFNRVKHFYNTLFYLDYKILCESCFIVETILFIF